MLEISYACKFVHLKVEGKWETDLNTKFTCVQKQPSIQKIMTQKHGLFNFYNWQMLCRAIFMSFFTK